MRNVMICVSVMLAVFLGWPLAFGGADGPSLQGSRAEASTIAVAAPAPAEARVTPAVVTPEVSAAPVAESCYKRYQREVKLCTGSAKAACALKSADHWDMCEATGFWPD